MLSLNVRTPVPENDHASHIGMVASLLFRYKPGYPAKNEKSARLGSPARGASLTDSPTFKGITIAQHLALLQKLLQNSKNFAENFIKKQKGKKICFKVHVMPLTGA